MTQGTTLRTTQAPTHATQRETPAPTPVGPSSIGGAIPPQTVTLSHKKFPISEPTGDAAAQCGVSCGCSVPCQSYESPQEKNPISKAEALRAAQHRWWHGEARRHDEGDADTSKDWHWADTLRNARLSADPNDFGYVLQWNHESEAGTIRYVMVSMEMAEAAREWAGLLADVFDLVASRDRAFLRAVAVQAYRVCGPKMLGFSNVVKLDPILEHDIERFSRIPELERMRLLAQYDAECKAAYEKATAVPADVREADAMRWADSLHDPVLVNDPNDFGYILTWRVGGTRRRLATARPEVAQRAINRLRHSDPQMGIDLHAPQLVRAVAIEMHLEHGQAWLDGTLFRDTSPKAPVTVDEPSFHNAPREYPAKRFSLSPDRLVVAAPDPLVGW